MSKISVTPIELKSLCTELNGLNERYRTSITNIKNNFNDINELRIWDGIDEKAYITKANDRYINTLDKIDILLEDYINYLDKTAISYASVEEFLYDKEIDV